MIIDSATSDLTLANRTMLEEGIRATFNIEGSSYQLSVEAKSDGTVSVTTHKLNEADEPITRRVFSALELSGIFLLDNGAEVVTVLDADNPVSSIAEQTIFEC